MLRSLNNIKIESSDCTSTGSWSLIGALIGFLIYTISLASAGNVMFRKDSTGKYRFRLFGSLKEGILKPFFRFAPDLRHRIQFFFRLDNPWFTVPTGTLVGFLISKY